MKYKLNKNIAIQETDQIIVINNNSNGAQLNLSLNSKDVLEDIKESKDVGYIINRFAKINNISENEARKQINNLLYVLLKQNFIDFNCETRLGDKILNIKSVLIELTDFCNYRCPHCYVNKTCTKTLSIDDIRDLTQELKVLNCCRIALTGGEIFTHKEFVDIYTYLYNEGFIVSINTNLSLLNDTIISCLKLYPPYEVEVSLYGYNSETYNDFTNTQDNFKQVVDNLSKLKALNINLVLKNIITKTNFNYFDKIEDLAKKLNIEFKSDYISFPQIDNMRNQNSQQISPKETIYHLKKHEGAKEYFLNLFSKSNSENGKLFKCKNNDDTFFFSSSKEISMCVCMQSKSYKYKKGNLKNILMELQKIKDIEFTENAKCLNCKMLPLCRYCPGKFFMETGNYELPPEWFCELGYGLYNEFIKGTYIIKKSFLSENELNFAFNIIKDNMTKLGFDVSDKDKEMWCGNIKQNLYKEDFYFYLVYINGKVEGFIEIVNSNGIFIVSEVQLSNQSKGTRAILEIIKFLYNNKEFENVEEFQFSILKHNNMSNKTFAHLGGEIISESERKFRYKISRNNVKQYLNNLKQL